MKLISEPVGILACDVGPELYFVFKVNALRVVYKQNKTKPLQTCLMIYI